MMFARQLEQIEAQLFEVKYPEGHAIELVPLNTAIDPGALEVHVPREGLHGRGEARLELGDGLPARRPAGQGGLAQAGQLRRELRVRPAAAPLGEVRQLRAREPAQHRGAPRRDAQARLEPLVRRQPDQHDGLANNALVSLVSVITGTWTSATADQILADAQKLINAAEAASKGVEKSNTVIFPVSRYVILATKFMGVSAPGMTVLDMLKKANPGVAFYQSYQLELANAAGNGPRAIACTSDSEKLEGLVPIEFEVLPAVDQGGQFEVKCMGRFGGVAIRYPVSVQYMDSI
jgi:hypothetical protein